LQILNQLLKHKVNGIGYEEQWGNILISKNKKAFDIISKALVLKFILNYFKITNFLVVELLAVLILTT
jgi:hypothetical protein